MSKDIITQDSKKQKKKTILDWDQVIFGDIPELDYVMPGFLAGTVGGIIAQGGTGKSFLGMELGCSMISKDLLGLDIKSSNQYITYITAEDPLAILQHRAFALTKHLNSEEREQVKKFLTLQSIQGQTPCLIDANGYRVEKWISGLKRACLGRRLVIIDTLRKFHQGNENDSGQMSLLLQVLEEIASETDCSILFTHHISKSGTGQTASRGSSVLVDNIRYQILLEKMSEQEAINFGVDENCRSKFVKINGSASKINYGESGGDHWLRRVEKGILVKAEPFDSPKKIKEKKEKKEKNYGGRK